MNKIKKNPKVIWAFCANKFGPWFKVPRKLVLDESFSHPYWSDGRDTSVQDKIGLVSREGYLCFSHEDKKEVEKFMHGFFECRKLLSGFFKDYK
jgi:hypothetical protein